MTETLSIRNMQEMNTEELQNTQGGGILAVAAAVAAVVGVYTICHEAGETIGKAIYYATH